MGWTSDQQQARGWMPSRLERGNDRARAQTGEVAEQVRQLSEDPPISPGVSDEEQESVDRIVATLEVDPALSRLSITQSHLQLNARSSSRTEDHAVPRSLLGAARHRNQRHLRSTRERGVGVIEHPSQPLGVRGVPNRASTRIGPHGQVEPEHRRDLRCLQDRQPGDLAVLNPTQPRSGDAGRIRDRLLASAKRESLVTELIAELKHGPLAASGASVKRSIGSGHVT